MKQLAPTSASCSSSAPLSSQHAKITQCQRSAVLEHKELTHTPTAKTQQIDTSKSPDSCNDTPPRILPTIKAFSAQCSSCLKWRLIPTKELYEEIRQTVTENPFVCSRASSWHANASCNDPSDMSQDASLLWAIDQPDIPLAPAGWERLLCFRGEGSGKFADVYYRSPTGTRLRSMRDVERFLAEHPEYASAGVQKSQFSFLKPKPLHPRGHPSCVKTYIPVSRLGAIVAHCSVGELHILFVLLPFVLSRGSFLFLSQV
ncbi:hypothetical protein GOP47_0030277 [Adiantum capillus-veneris]|nr:hypothetical protein GOP47_0030277 [Adiantum capillus-veneris]